MQTPQCKTHGADCPAAYGNLHTHTVGTGSGTRVFHCEASCEIGECGEKIYFVPCSRAVPKSSDIAEKILGLKG